MFFLSVKLGTHVVFQLVLVYYILLCITITACCIRSHCSLETEIGGMRKAQELRLESPTVMSWAGMPK